jgi:hypothetical protein
MNATIGEPLDLLMRGAERGLVDVLTIDVYDPADRSVILEASRVGIIEPRPAAYRATRKINAAGSFIVRWTRIDTQTVLKEEPVDVRLPAGAARLSAPAFTYGYR